MRTIKTDRRTTRELDSRVVIDLAADTTREMFYIRGAMKTLATRVVLPAQRYFCSGPHIRMLFRNETRLIKSLFSPFLPLFFTLFLTACASGYTEFYKQQQGMTPEIVSAMRVKPPPAIPAVERVQPGDIMEIRDAYASRGYIMIGSSMFKSGHPESEDSAVRQAQKVGADLVLILSPRYAGSMTSNIPMTTLTKTTKASLKRSDDITTNVPVTIPLADYGAVYFVKNRFDAERANGNEPNRELEE